VSDSRESQYSASHDKHFFDTFMLVLGILVAVAFALYILARIVAANTQEAHVLIDPAAMAATNARLQPVALLAVSGQDNSAVEAAAPPPAAPAVAAAPMTGEAVYNMACVACHGQGIGGAPVFGDKAAWAPRIAKGMDLLHQHSIQGFQGQAGFMPPKGGRVDLADESIINAVDHMVSAAR
jgi:cytochrome c5